MIADESQETGSVAETEGDGQMEVFATTDLPSLFEHEDGSFQIKVKETGDLARIFGGTNDRFGCVLVEQCFQATGAGANSIDKHGKVVEIVSALAPRDALEAVLATQMAATHMAIMRHSKRMADANHLETLELHERLLTKLSRTFTAQMEALRKHRNGGKQTVTVQHVNVADGGQAIVGSVSQGEGHS